MGSQRGSGGVSAGQRGRAAAAFGGGTSTGVRTTPTTASGNSSSAKKPANKSQTGKAK
jgi:hypothetical protein